MVERDTCGPCSDTDIACGERAPGARRTRGLSLDKTAQTRQQIAQAALAEFVLAGVARSTMDRIARRAQVAKGTLYLYYPSKDALLRGVIEHALQHTIAYRPLVRKPGETVQSLIRRSVLPSMGKAASKDLEALALLLMTEARHVPELARLYKALAFDPWHKHMTALMQLAADEGELHTSSVSRCAQLLASPFWMGMVHNGLLSGEETPRLSIRPLMDQMITTLFAAPGPA